mgnify:CR=1 FL=1
MTLAKELDKLRLMPRCKICKDKYESKYFLQKTCLNPSCILEWKDKVKAREWRVEKKKIKESLKTLKDYHKELQPVFNKFIRLRDSNQSCISCSKPLTGKVDAGHYFPVGSVPNLRYHEWNCHSQCVWCNQHLHGNLIEYTKNLPKRIGEVKFNVLLQKRNEERHYTIPEVKGLIVYYKEKIKNF